MPVQAQKSGSLGSFLTGGFVAAPFVAFASFATWSLLGGAAAVLCFGLVVGLEVSASCDGVFGETDRTLLSWEFNV